MGQRKVRLRIAHFLAIAALLILGCEKPQSTPATSRSEISVASLVPAATDLIDGMGAGGQLVAISNWDPQLPRYAHLPRVGDYRTIDWEKLSELRPGVMITQFAPDKRPAGLDEKSNALGIQLVNVRINRIDELYQTLEVLGGVLNRRAEAELAQKRIRDELGKVAARVKDRPQVRTLLVRSSSGLEVVGGGNYLDELLSIAGGENVLSSGENSYPTIDREMLLKLDPDVILQLLPGASPQVVEQAREVWKTLPQLRAVGENRVFTLTENFLLLPGSQIGTVADLFAAKLHAEVKP